MAVIAKYERAEGAAVVQPSSDERIGGGSSENWLAPFRRDLSAGGFDAEANATAEAEAAAQEDLKP